MDVDLLPVRPLVEADSDWLLDLLLEATAGPQMVSRGRLHDGLALPGLVAEHDGAPAGALLWEIRDGELEVVFIGATVDGVGAGTALLERALALAHDEHCRRAFVVTTNDNTPAIRFYQRRGWELVDVRIDALDESRRLKPTIPLVGHDGIPMRHELEFEVRVAAHH